MYIAYIFLALILSLVLVASGVGKLTKKSVIVESLTKAGVPLSWFPYLAGVEFVGAVGLIAGIFESWIGIAAAIGVSLYFAGAVLAHVIAKDTKGLFNPVPFLLLSIGAVALRLISS